MFNELHLCTRCLHREECPLGLTVESGALDEYLDETMIREDLNPDWDYEVRVVVCTCERFED